jgi:hypothetical protein
LLLLAWTAPPAAAQFRDDFDQPTLSGWTFFTGDGAAVMDFRPVDGRGVISVDATRDRDNIWWALVKREISGSLDLATLARPGHELRLEARVRASHAPRRVNLHVNTQKTTDFHTHLMEYDLPDTLWHTISMTTHRFQAGPGDQVNVQLALMDWGLGRYRVAIDWYRADVVEAARAAPDLGEPIPYQPPIGDLTRFHQVQPPAEAAVIDAAYPDLSFAGWHQGAAGGAQAVLTVGGSQSVILRWDLHAFAGRRAAGAGVLELTTASLQRVATDPEELGQVRAVEILGGDPAWQRATVTFASLTRGQPLEDVFNGQMVSDAYVAEAPGGRTRVTLSRAVLQRLLDGRTRGILIRPLGPIVASFRASGTTAEAGPRLYFSVE